MEEAEEGKASPSPCCVLPADSDQEIRDDFKQVPEVPAGEWIQRRGLLPESGWEKLYG